MRLARTLVIASLALPALAQALPLGWQTRKLQLGDETVSIANAINNLGRIVGTVQDSDGARHAVIFEQNTVRAIGTLGGLQSEANGLSPRGDIAGSAQIDNGYWHAYVRGLDGTLRDLGTLGGHNSTAMAVNNRGQSAGYADTPDQQWHAYFHDGTRMRDIGTLGGHYSAAMGLNLAGQVVGLAETAEGRRHAFLYTPERGLQDLGTLGGRQSAAYGINEQGVIVGVAETADRELHAFVYKDGKMHDLGAALDNGSSAALAINNLNQVLGIHRDGYRRAFVYDNPRDVRYLSGDNSLYQPRSINDQGDIVGGFLSLSKVRAVVLRALTVPPVHMQLGVAQWLALAMALLMGAWLLQRRLLDWWRPRRQWQD
ncbi:HAF repeat-containing protein [Massilia sp. TS11]|uniref:HAF repeat-containing protein n=1 Tax=Massilia sp. TS11 TaxID=2908003 RepID=UPI001EDAC2C7|nr:HAF repeat-containing protein [Massilia sp. TS11]MCG2586788.1 HAF repeat-containing protein [Massilia sp. TS11]